MTKRQIMEKIPFKLLAVFLLLAAGISAGGFVFYRQQRASTVAHIQGDLNTIAQLKSEEITNWRKERYKDAYVLSNSEILISVISQWFAKPGDKHTEKLIFNRLNTFRVLNSYENIILTDAADKVKLETASENADGLGTNTKKLIKMAADSHKILFSDFYYCPECGHEHLDIFAPLFVNKKYIGCLIFRINPQVYLYTLIQAWPTISKTGETVLLRREGDQVLHLNKLRHQKDTDVKLRVPITDTLLPGVMAVLGKKGMVESHDYRGVPVVAALRHIADSPWFMVTKVDKEEIYAPLKRQAGSLAALVAMIVLLLAAVLSFIWQAERRGFYKKQYQLELDKRALVRHFDYLTKYANDIIFLLDQDRRIVEINERGVEAYGYAREELLGREAGLIRAEEQREKFKAQMRELAEKGSLVYETMHRRKDGTTFPVEISARVIEIEGKVYLQGIVRDITERKQFEQKIQDRTEELEATNEQLMASEEELKAADEEMRHNIEELQRSRDELLASKARFSHLFQGINSGVAVYRAVDDGADFVFEDFNPAGQRMDQITKDQAIGKKVTEVFPGIKSMGLFEVFQRVWRTGNPEHYPVSMYKDDRLEGWRENYVYKLPSGEIVAVYDDLTEQKKAEIALKKSESKLRRFYESEMLGVIYWNTEGVITDANDKFLEMTGYTREDLTAGRVDWVNMTPPEYRHLDENSLAELKSTGYNKTPFEKEYIRKDGTRMPILLAGAMVDEARMNGVAFVLDITERKRVEQALLENQKYLKASQQIAHLGHWHLNVATNQVVWSEELYKMYGFDPLLPPPPYTEHMKLFTPESWERLSTALANTRETGVAYELELVTARKDGSNGWMWVRGEAEVDAEGKIVGLWGVAQDITERKEIEWKNMQLLELLDNAANAVTVHDLNGRFIYANRSSHEILGYTREEYLALNLNQIDMPESAELIAARMDELRSKGQVVFEVRHRKKDGTALPMMVSAKMAVWQGQPVILSIATDITERKQAEEKIQAQLSELQRWQGTMLDREGRVLDLKREVNEILARQGQPKKYGNG